MILSVREISLTESHVRRISREEKEIFNTYMNKEKSTENGVQKPNGKKKKLRILTFPSQGINMKK